MPDVTPRLCKACKYYQVSNHEMNLGHCHRYPPVVITIQPMAVEFIYVAPNDWCGEFKENV